MPVHQSDLDPYERQLQSTVVSERDRAAETLSDYLERGDLSTESKVTVGNWLLDALWIEQDATVLESILHGLGWINFKNSCPDVAWHRLGEFLPKLQTPLLGEYAISTLGECGDPSMIRFIDPYLHHHESIVRDEARAAIDCLNRAKHS